MILRACVVIPTFNNSASILEVVQSVLEQCQFPILILDDGSDTPVASLLSEVKNPRVTCLRNPQNLGKGKALQLAFQYCTRMGYTHALTMDGDGQHLASELSLLSKAIVDEPFAMVIGSRRMVSENVPGISHFGRKFSNFWVKYQTGARISDSQSGFRAYPLFWLQNMRFFCQRYDFEIEVLIRMLWKGVQILEVETEVYYPPKEIRVSHFDKFWDNLRISMLNTVLVILSLLRTRPSRFQASSAMFLGVLIGSTPFFGLHTVIAAVASFLLRLNAIYMLVGTHISFGPMAPILAAAGIKTGQHLLPAQSLFSQWLVGSLVVGSGLGLIAALITWILMSPGMAKTQNWTGKTRGGRFGNGFLKFVLKHFGIQPGYFCLYFIIPYFYLFAPKARHSLNEYWKVVKPELNYFERQARIVSHLFRFGQILMDRVFSKFTRESTGKKAFATVPDGMDHVIRAADAGKGLILLGAHVGAWDLAASLMDTNGFTNSLHVVEYRTQGISYAKVKGQNEVEHIKYLADEGRNASIFDLHQLLNKGQTIGIMADRPLGAKFELVSFFGKLSPFDATPFRVAAALQVPVCYTFGFRTSSGYNFFADPPRYLKYTPGVSQDLQCRLWIQEFANALENKLMQYPDQWFNFFRFWSSLPSSPLPESASPNANAPKMTAAPPAAADLKVGKKVGPKRNYLLEELQSPTPGAPAAGTAASKNVAP